ncbi:pyridoxal-phosphate dependent enzyme [Halanaerobium sp. MA284_MarDTE_T2]|uniref:pyridoxal-phosphate dependent enzyme n=1 Tax=Halanaerobium sp. MA284_MarDTE_T2 TaxID=2183913 RepID=UPI000E164C9B|nr:pyridoxal-phosphate dependent enzyme [Halanaerobium sp. MA284_MarDTE_T2]RCW47763.1 pyridoxal-phosphate dependent enzyme [Halanaerobium sp. MA284_MarDTE_T2]
MSGNEVFLKLENLQRTGSFKIRGAYNKMCNLTEEGKKNGVVAASAGNHAQVQVTLETKNEDHVKDILTTLENNNYRVKRTR